MDKSNIAIMQPYLFPYIGYFQLIQAADLLVFYDDVHFINRGWINRNRILVNGEPHLISIPCKKASQNKLIYEVELGLDHKSRQKILRTFQMSYKKAPYFKQVYQLIENTLSGPEKNIAELAAKSIKEVIQYLGLSITCKNSSVHYPHNRNLKKADRLIDICHQESIFNYINPQGGKEIYTKAYFKEKGVKLHFLVPQIIPYPQFGNTFVPWLSILDIMMFNSREKISKAFLNAYELQ